MGASRGRGARVLVRRRHRAGAATLQELRSARRRCQNSSGDQGGVLWLQSSRWWSSG